MISMASVNATAPDELPADLLKLLLNDDVGLSSAHDTIVEEGRGSVPQEKGATIIVLHKNKGVT